MGALDVSQHLDRISALATTSHLQLVRRITPPFFLLFLSLYYSTSADLSPAPTDRRIATYEWSSGKGTITPNLPSRLVQKKVSQGMFPKLGYAFTTRTAGVAGFHLSV